MLAYNINKCSFCLFIIFLFNLIIWIDIYLFSEWIKSESEWVKVSILSVQGDEVLVPVDRSLRAGSHDVKIDVSELSSGSYLISVKKGSGIVTSKLYKN